MNCRTALVGDLKRKWDFSLLEKRIEIKREIKIKRIGVIRIEIFRKYKYWALKIDEKC